MAFLRREGHYANAPRRDLILLVLNLPKEDGRDVLAELKDSPARKSMPVILTTSAIETKIEGSYQHCANCPQASGTGGHLKVVKSIDSFWLSMLKMPREAHS
jgi:two-component system, chemotaxis family, response regulator Rcp1